MNRTLRRSLSGIVTAAAALAGGAAPGWAEELADERASYSYVRTIDGQATLASSQRAPGEPVGLNEPLQRGDQVNVERGARLEIVLADRNLLRVGGDSSLRLSRVAFSADGDDRATQLDLEQGELLLDVGEEALGDELPEIRTPEGTLYIQQPGRYRVLLSATGDLQVTVREGYAELLTSRGSTVLRGGEEAWTGADLGGNVQVTDAGPLGALERWSDDLELRSRRASNRELRVEPHLAYAASSLDDYGSWVYVDASWYWRPRVAVGWRPYWDGRWAYTPSGLTWVSSEPWGWVPYHYGSWSLVPGYGWVWRPGYHYSPAWVYWYVGPSWTGWCPVGYYTHHYRNYWDYGFRFGVYGWAGGSWGAYADWCFLPSLRLFDRHGHSWRRTGTHLARTERPEVPRGILTTDTGGLPRQRWDRPQEVLRDLGGRRSGRDASSGGALPEVTDFVARRPALPPAVERAVLRDPVERRGVRRGTPLDPGAPSLGARGRGGDVAEWRGRSRDAEGERVELGRRASGGPPATGDRLGGGFGRSVGERPGRAPELPADVSPGSARRAERPAAPWVEPRGGGERSARPVTRSPRATSPVSGDDRQGWRRNVDGAGDDRGGQRGGWSDGGSDRSGGGSGRVERGATDRSWTSDRGSRAAADEPVSRVIGGVRRAQPADRDALQAAPRTQAMPPVGWRGSPGSASPRASAPPAASPRVSAPPAVRGPQSVSPYGRAPQGGPTTRSTAPPPTAKASPPPTSRGGGRPPATARGSGSSSGDRGGRSQASSGSSRSQSSQGSQSSSPPPRRGKPPGSGG